MSQKFTYFVRQNRHFQLKAISLSILSGNLPVRGKGWVEESIFLTHIKALFRIYTVKSI